MTPHWIKKKNIQNLSLHTKEGPSLVISWRLQSCFCRWSILAIRVPAQIFQNPKAPLMSNHLPFWFQETVRLFNFSFFPLLLIASGGSGETAADTAYGTPSIFFTLLLHYIWIYMAPLDDFTFVSLVWFLLCSLTYFSALFCMYLQFWSTSSAGSKL